MVKISIDILKAVIIYINFGNLKASTNIASIVNNVNI